MKLRHLFLVGLFAFAPIPLLSAQDNEQNSEQDMAKKNQNAYDFSFESIAGGELPLKKYEGKVLMVVNTASLCGFTDQYADLQSLYETYKDDGLVVIGVPANNFNNQEPEDEEAIKEFCDANFGITFPMTAKENVVGDNPHPFYAWANEQAGFIGSPKWNFHKYIIDREGNFADWFSSATNPQEDKVKKKIKELL